MEQKLEMRLIIVVNMMTSFQNLFLFEKKDLNEWIIFHQKNLKKSLKCKYLLVRSFFFSMLS